MKITKQNIIDWSKPHPNNLMEARQTVLETNHLIISIVGGAKGLYGDFENDFEIALFNKDNNSFITKFFYPEGNDDVIGYMKGEEMEEFLNGLVQKGFQVR